MTYEPHARGRRNRNHQRRQQRESRGLWITLILALLVAGGGGVAYWHQVIRPGARADRSTVPHAGVAERAAQPEPVREGKSAISAKPTRTASKPLPVDPRMILADPMRADEHEAARAAIRRQEQAALAASATVTDPVAPTPPDTIVSEFFGMTMRESGLGDEASGTDSTLMSSDDSQEQAIALSQQFSPPTPESTAWQSFTGEPPK